MITGQVGITVSIGAADGGCRNGELLAVGLDGNLGHSRYIKRLTVFREADAVQVEESVRTLWLALAAPLRTVVVSLFDVSTISYKWQPFFFWNR